MALGSPGFDIVASYRNEAARADPALGRIQEPGRWARLLAGDMPWPVVLEAGVATVAQWSGHLASLVMNTSGGLAGDPVGAGAGSPH